ncbi:MAG: response regulator [Thermodesulfobacteriota bacterium]
MKTVLIAEDDPIYLSLLTSALSKYRDKFEVIGAGNGKQAMDVLARTQVSLVITDVMMPEVDGLQLLAHVNSHYPLIPCFVMTAYETPKLRDSLPKDIRRFFRKPFPPEKLGPEILEVVGQDTPQGFIHGISVSSFMMMIEMEKKTCILEIRLPSGNKGLFYFENGVLYNAVSKDLKGEAAALAFVARKRAQFAFRPLPEKKIAKQQAMPLKDLLEKSTRAAEQKTPAAKKESHPGLREELNLAGQFKAPDNSVVGQMTVTRLSIPCLRMKLNNRPQFVVGQKLRIEFNLDDKPRSLVSKDVITTQIEELNVEADFCSREHYDRLGPYLHFNGLEIKNW